MGLFGSGYGFFEILMPKVWPILPYSIRYRITLLIERFRSRASIEIPASDVEIFYAVEDTKTLFPSALNINDNLVRVDLPKYTLVISCKGEKDTIEEFLVSLTKQSYPPVELIICDAGQEIEIKLFLDDWAKNNLDIKVDYFQAVGANIAYARNRGVERATSEIVAFADLGTRLDSNWGKNLIVPFSLSSIDCSMGWYRGVGEIAWQQEIKKFIMPKLESLDVARFLPSTRSLAIKRTAFLECGGFLESLTFAAEDSLFGYEMKRKGLSLGFSPDAVVDWDLPNNLLSMWKKLFKYAKGDAETGFLFWGHYFNLLSEALKGCLDLLVVVGSCIVCSFFISIKLASLLLIIFFPIRRMINYFLRFGVLGKRPFTRLAVLFILSSAQLFGFCRGLRNLKGNKHLLGLIKSRADN